LEAPVEVFVFQVFLYSVLLLVIARLLGGIEVTNYGQALLAAFVLSVLNVLIRPILIILTAPILLLTLGLFLWVINAWLLMLTSKFVDGFKVRDFTTALLAALLLSIFTMGWSVLVG
jgi:putative membrane protein